MKYTWTATREINRKDRIVKGFMTNLGMQRTPFSAYFDPSGGHQCSACTHRIKNNGPCITGDAYFKILYYADSK
jgi:hypothetical protein